MSLQILHYYMSLDANKGVFIHFDAYNTGLFGKKHVYKKHEAYIGQILRKI